MKETTSEQRGAYRAVSIALFLCLFAGQAALIAMSPVLAEAASDLARLDGRGRSAADGHRPRGGHHGARCSAPSPERIGLGRQLLGGLGAARARLARERGGPEFRSAGAGSVAGGRRRRRADDRRGRSPRRSGSRPELRTRALSWALVGQPAAWIVGMPLIGLVGEHSWRYGWLAAPARRRCRGRGARRAAGAAAGRPVHRPARARAALGDRLLARWLASELLANAAWAGTLVYSGALFAESYGTSTRRDGRACSRSRPCAYVAGNMASPAPRRA